MASGGYPGAYPKGMVITGLEDAERDAHVTVFHAGTKRSDGAIVTNGGRVLNVTATGAGIRESIEHAYAAVEQIAFNRAHYRTDIGKKALKRGDAS
jgi:phosphoribosylamine--glycine ligase